MVYKVKNIFITGKAGAGKTTLIKEVCFKFLDHIGGFYTEEIREGSSRVGFRVCDFSGKKGIMAYKGLYRGLPGKPKLGKYGVDLGVLEDVGVSAMIRAMEEKKLIVVDEVGKMECFSNKFREVLTKCLNSPKYVLATITYESQPFQDELKKLPNTTLIYLDRKNYFNVKREIIDWIRSIVENL